MHFRLFLLIRERLKPIPEQVPSDLLEPVLAALQTGSHYAYLRQLHDGSDSWERVRAGMADLARLSNRSTHIPVLVMVFPIASPEGYESYPLLDVHGRVMMEAERNGLDALDLTASFELAQRNFDNRCFIELLHPSGWGHKVAASGLLNWLIESDVVPKGCFDLESILAEPSLDPMTAAILRDGSQP